MNAFADRAVQAYAAAYFGLIIALAVVEWVFPRRAAGESLTVRWVGNLGVALINAVVLRWVFPLVGFAWAAFCVDRHWGLLNQLALPGWLAFVLTLLVLDFGNYVSHFLAHRIGWLWRLHRTHHTDHAFDFTTALRFHPLEGIYSTLVGLGFIAVLGPPPVAVLIFQMATVGIAFFEHANVRIPSAVDRVLRLVVVTPALHCVHHSQVRREAQSNLGSIFPWWDRMFGTYVHAPAAGQDAIAFGVSGFSDRRHLWLHWMLASPFFRPPRRPPS